MSFQGYVDAAYQATRMTGEEEAEHEDRMFVLGVIEYLDRAHAEIVDWMETFQPPWLVTAAGLKLREQALQDALGLMRRLHPGLEER